MLATKVQERLCRLVCALSASLCKKKIILALTRENLSSVFANNKGADQPAHSQSLISAFVIRLLESFVCLFDLILYVPSTIFQL